ncbi:biliverdin-producing heme oxygenase [Achromobacter sp. GG226]|uniref:biliverdin-producing heme oxygenase n=1 Tax=Verticiella alkaliphila TaxID=2779529 RepID=UPI001C0BA7B4|nr:biliverdin-producing heme oxygenase [Verticiella sp. GG226]MBU4610238.1 biliverdin-producing heme oxygenase [Verticiella sp. GG226]
MPALIDTSTRLSQRLRDATAAQHERMHQQMHEAQPFAARERFAGFVAAQYVFQRDVEHLFDDAYVKAQVPDLAVRGRLAAAQADLADLAREVPDDAIATTQVQGAPALGWLYVSEGSTLGAAFLLKEAEARLGLSADFGARNLAAYPEGRGAVWRRFVTALDSDALSRTDGNDVIAGAHAAFERFAALLAKHLPRA